VHFDAGGAGRGYPDKGCGSADAGGGGANSGGKENNEDARNNDTEHKARYGDTWTAMRAGRWVPLISCAKIKTSRT